MWGVGTRVDKGSEIFENFVEDFVENFGGKTFGKYSVIREWEINTVIQQNNILINSLR